MCASEPTSFCLENVIAVVFLLILCYRGFSENVVVTKTSYQMLGILFSDRERTLPPSTEIFVLTFVVKKVPWCFPGCLFLENRRDNLTWNVVFVVVIVLESKALYYLQRNWNRLRAHQDALQSRGSYFMRPALVRPNRIPKSVFKT